MNLNPTPLEILILVLVSLSIYAWMRHRVALRRWWAELWKKRRGRRHLKPKSPEVCPRCMVWSHILPGHGHRHARPWREVRSKSGRRKRVDTRGYACQNLTCEYYGVTDPAIHALVSAGKRGVRKDILFLRCQACGQRQTSRTDTPVKARKHHWFPDPQLLYGQLIKPRNGYKLKFLSSIIRLGERAAFRARLLAQGLSSKVQTSAIQRHNLTLRELVAPLSRRTWSMAHDILHLWSHTDLLQLHPRPYGPGSADTRPEQAPAAHACHGCRIDPPGLVIPLADRLTLPGSQNPPTRWAGDPLAR